MYFWNIKKVTEELATGEISEHNVFKYFIAHALIFLIAMIPAYETTRLDTIISIALLFITIGGLFYARRCNGGSEGKDFFTRLFSISWVMTIKFFVLLVLVAFIGGFFEAITEADIRSDAPAVEGFMIGILSIVFYWRIGVHISKVNEFASE